MSKVIAVNGDGIFQEVDPSVFVGSSIITVSAKNNTASTIPAYAAVTLSYTGGIPLFEMVPTDLSSGGGTDDADGFTTASAAINAVIDVQIRGPLEGFTGLTPDKRMWVNPASPGDIQDTTPTGAGERAQYVGYCMSTTKLLIEPQPSIERA